MNARRPVVALMALTLFMAACARPSSNGSHPPTAAAPAAPIPVAAAAPMAPSAAARPALVQSAFIGEGSLEVEGKAAGKTRLALDALAIEATTTGDVVETAVEHVFRNDAAEVLEGTFRFPLPEGAILTGLAMEIGGKLVNGELVERDKARKVYEQIVDEMLDPALLEWENGQTFKLRVFPIEPKTSKRVVIRFIAPLHRTSDGVFFAFRPPSSDADLSTHRVKVTVDRRPIGISSGERAASGEILVRVANTEPIAHTENAAAPAIVSETTPNADYWLAHVRPVLGPEPAPAPTAKQALVVLCDRSRSMLEARELQKKTLGMLLDELGDGDRFTVITGDVHTRPFGAFRPAAADEKRAALDFVDDRAPDGASDLGALVGSASAAIEEARAGGLEPVVVYIGDGTATWGETRAAELERIVGEALRGATMHAVLLGKSVDAHDARALAAGGHGRLLRPKTEAEAERASMEIARARGQRRVTDVHIVGADGADVPSSIPSTLYEGDAIELALRVEKGARAPSDMQLVGMQNGKAFAQPIALASAKPARHVARRWAKAKIDFFERDGEAHKNEIVETSLEHGVMSRYTSFLVLESDAAYARFRIARKARETNDEARVSGRDLGGDGRGPSVSPDHLQPGDPEVRIPAPRNAQSVVVVFPFGETKSASFEPGDDGGAWVARFLVDRRTPDGTYEILVRITHADGRVEILELPYVVDTKRPNLDVTVTPKPQGAFEIHAKQRLTAEEIEAQAPSSTGTLAERRERFAHILTDAKRVEVRAPDGQVLSLVHVRLGEFAGTWTPARGYTGEGKLRVVAVDRALNERVLEVELPR